MLSDRAKRILQIVGFIALTTLIGFALYWVFFRTPTPKTASKPPALTDTQPTGSLIPSPPVSSFQRTPAQTPSTPPSPTTEALGGPTEVTSLTTNPTLAPSLATDGSSLIYYNRTDGKFYRITADGKVELLSERVFFNVSAVNWAPDRAQAILEYPDGSKILYNFDTERAATLPRHWQEFNFSPSSDSIAFLSLGLDEDSRWLAIANPDGSGTKPIEPLGKNANKVQVAWSPAGQIVGFSKTGSPQGLNEQEILFIGTNKENFRSLVVNGINFRGKWSPDGARLLYSTVSGADGWRPSIWITDAKPSSMGQNKVALGLNTFADKCSFGNATTIYCAVPTSLEEGAGLYPQIAATTPDHLYRIDLQTGARELIAVPQGDHTIDSIVVTANEKTLFFSDKISGQLYKINLK